MARTSVSLRFSTFATFPAIGDASILYIATNTNLLYRWTGSAYVLIWDGTWTGTVTQINTAWPIAGWPITTTGTITTSMSTNKLIWRWTSGTGVMEEITLGTNLSLSWTTLNATGGASPWGSIYDVQINNGSGWLAGDNGFKYQSGQVNIGALATSLTTLNIDGSNNYGNLTFSDFANTTSQWWIGIESADDNIIIGSIKGDLSIYGGTGKINFSADYGSTDHMVITDTGNVGIGTTTPAYKEDVIGTTTTLAAPSAFSASLVIESLANPPIDTLALIYWPQEASSPSSAVNLAGSGFNTLTANLAQVYAVFAYRNIWGYYTSPSGASFVFYFPYSLNTSVDNGSVENSGYSGYNNNDSVSAVIYGYNNTLWGGIYYTSAGVSLSTINLTSNPSGIDWNWTAETLADGTPVSGYIIEITDSTTSTVYSYDVGNVLTYADMNVGGTVSYTPFSGASIDFDINTGWAAAVNGDWSAVDGYIVVNSISGYMYDAGNSTSYTDSGNANTLSVTTFTGYTAGFQNFSYDMFAMPLSPSGAWTYYNDNGNGYNISVNESFWNGTQFWIQHVISSSIGNAWKELQQSNGNSFQNTGDITYYQTADYFDSPTVTPNHYGILSDGSTLTRDYQAYTYETLPSLYFSSLHTDASTVDPNDSQYYYFAYSETNPAAGSRILENSAGSRDVWGSSGTIYQDAFGGFFSDPPTITPNSLTSSAGRFTNSSDSLGLVPQLILNSTSSSNDYEAIAFKHNSTTRATISWNAGMTIDSSNYMLFSLGGSTRAGLDGGSFRLFSNTGFVITDSGANAWFYANQSSKNVSIGTNSGGTARLQIAAGTATGGTAPLKINAGTLLTTEENGAIEHDTNHWYGTDNSARRMFIQSATSSVITDGAYMRVDSSGRAVWGTELILTGGFVSVGVSALFTQGLSLSSGKDITMGTGSRYTWGYRTTLGTTAISTSLNLANHSPYTEFTGSTAGRTLTLPTSASVGGVVYTQFNRASVSVTVATTSSQNMNYGLGTVTSVVMQQGDMLFNIATASTTWDTFLHQFITTLDRGGTGTNLTATGGTGQYLKQSSVGAVITVGTIAASDIASGAALTKTDDTNVTMTLGGTPATALLKAASMTLGWTGLLAVGRGGTGLSTATFNGVMLGNNTSPFAFTAAPSAGNVLRGSSLGIPAFGTIDLSNSNTVLASSKLPIANGGTNSTTLLGAGIVTVINTVALTGQTADITTTNVATVAGLYQVNYSLQDTTADITAGAVVLTISYTDGAGSTTSTATQVLTGLGRQSGVLYIQLASGNLTYATSHTGLFGTATYALYITTERLL